MNRGRFARLDFHRNFFGERCGITTGGLPAYTSCAAFGLERWLSVLHQRYDGWDAAIEAVERA